MANVDVDALSHILMEEHNQHIEADSVHALISQVAQGTTFTEAYSCIIQVTETLDKQKEPKAMSLEDWIIAHSKDPVISEINKHMLKGCRVFWGDPKITKQYLRQCSHLVLHKEDQNSYN